MHVESGSGGRQAAASSQQLLHLGLSWELQSAGRRHTAAVLATVMCMHPPQCHMSPQRCTCRCCSAACLLSPPPPPPRCLSVA